MAGRLSLARVMADHLVAAEASADDGGSIAYVNRLARRREGGRALTMEHLAPLALAYERAEMAYRAANDNRQHPPVFECHHAPVQHGKTTHIQGQILRLLRRNPRMWIAYASYNEATAVAKMYEVRQLADAEGIRVDPNFDTATEFRTREGGGIVCGGIVGGPWTSRGFDLIVVDDPYKTAQDAFSIAWRTAVESAFWTALWTRRRPWTSIIVNAARWHPNDLTGILIKKRWRYVCLPALDDALCNACEQIRRHLPPLELHACRALWPARWSRDELLANRDGRPANDNSEAIDPVPAAFWAALWQGRPAPEGGKVFDPASWPRYSTLPTEAYVEGMGLDLAYGGKDRNDHSAFVVGRRYGRRIYIIEADDRAQGVELYACRVAARQIERAGGPRLILPQRAEDIEGQWMPQLRAREVQDARRIPCRWYTSTTEAGTASLARGYGARVDAVKAAVDKLARVQAGGYKSAAAEGRVLVPEHASPGLLSFLRAHDEFTGAEGDFDDPVDAGCAMHDLLAVPMRLGNGRLELVGPGDDERAA